MHNFQIKFQTMMIQTTICRTENVKN